MHAGFSPRSSTTSAPPCGHSSADLQTPPPDETDVILCQPEDQTRDELMVAASALPAKSQSCDGYFIIAQQHSYGQSEYSMDTQCGTPLYPSGTHHK